MTRFHRNLNISAVVLPFVAVLATIPMLWNELIGWTDLTLFAVMYAVSTMGITVGFHRLLTHRAFQTYKPIEYLFAALGSMAVEGPVIGCWHHNHHAFPRSALHGLRWWEVDPGGWVIRGMQRLGLAWNVVRITKERQRDKLAEASA